MRKEPLVTGEYYHIYNRGVDKRDIFMCKEDLERFIESILEFNNVEVITSISNVRKTKNQIVPEALSGKPLISVIGCCLNPNHFHFILKQLEDGGISKFMQKLQAGYTYYLNVKNSRTGALLQGAFKSHHIYDDNYFKKLIGYVNFNNEVHDIPLEKSHLVFSGSSEYKNNNFNVISKIEGENILKMFGGVKGFEKYCKEIISVIRKERGKMSLLEEYNLPDRT